jgi:hypothetical protein
VGDGEIVEIFQILEEREIAGSGCIKRRNVINDAIERRARRGSPALALRCWSASAIPRRKKVLKARSANR